MFSDHSNDSIHITKLQIITNLITVCIFAICIDDCVAVDNFFSYPNFEHA